MADEWAELGQRLLFDIKQVIGIDGLITGSAGRIRSNVTAIRSIVRRHRGGCLVYRVTLDDGRVAAPEVWLLILVGLVILMIIVPEHKLSYPPEVLEIYIRYSSNNIKNSR